MYQYSLVVWVIMRACAGLAVLWSANSGVTEEARRTLLTELTLSVMQAALKREIYLVYRSAHLDRTL